MVTLSPASAGLLGKAQESKCAGWQCDQIRFILRDVLKGGAPQDDRHLYYTKKGTPFRIHKADTKPTRMILVGWEPQKKGNHLIL